MHGALDRPAVEAPYFKRASIGASGDRCEQRAPPLSRPTSVGLTDLSPDQLELGLGAILDGGYESDQRTVLTCDVIRGGQVVSSIPALATFSRSDSDIRSPSASSM